MFTIHTYWQGPHNTMLDLCLESLKFHNPEAKIWHPELIAAEGGQEVLDFIQGLPHALASDLIRIWILKKYGGVWVDTDTIHVAPLTEFLEMARDHDLVGVYNRHNPRGGYGSSGLNACPFGMREGSPAGPLLYEWCQALLKQKKAGGNVPYSTTSTGILCRLHQSQQGTMKIKRIEHWRYNPLPWNKAREAYLPHHKQPPYDPPEEVVARLKFGVTEVPHYPVTQYKMEYRSYWNPRAVCYHLTNVGFDPFKQFTREQILHGKSFVSFLFQKSFGLPPAVLPRSWSILEHLPRHRDIEAVEVGVFQGDNARQLLQQRPRLKLHLVDAWGTEHTRMDGSRRPGGKHNFAGVMASAKQKLAPFADRIIWHKGISTEMANEIADRSLDLAFIDGDHTKPGCYADLVAFIPKVKPGGWAGGHDMDHLYDQEGRCFGVTAAVQDYFPQKEIERGLDTTWFIQIGEGDYA